MSLSACPHPQHTDESPLLGASGYARLSALTEVLRLFILRILTHRMNFATIRHWYYSSNGTWVLIELISEYMLRTPLTLGLTLGPSRRKRDGGYDAYGAAISRRRQPLSLSILDYPVLLPSLQPARQWDEPRHSRREANERQHLNAQRYYPHFAQPPAWQNGQNHPVLQIFRRKDTCTWKKYRI